MEQTISSLLKPFTAYLVGVLTTAMAVSAGSGRWGLICFGLGALSVALTAAWALKSQKRAAWVVKQLVRFLDVPEPKKATRRVRAITETKPEAPKKPSAFADCVLALRGLGSDTETARYLAGQATQRLPEDASTKDVLKLALSINGARA